MKSEVILGKCLKNLKFNCNCYNGALIPIMEDFLLVYRKNKSLKNGSGIDFIEYIFLDKKFNIITKEKRLDLISSYNEDPKILLYKDILYMFFGGPNSNPDNWKERSMYFCKIKILKKELQLIQVPKKLKVIDKNEKCEKNWVPFIFDDKIYILYSIAPHIVYKLEEDTLIDPEITQGFLDLKGLIPSCGTPPLLIENKFLSFFHSMYYPFSDLKYSNCIEDKKLSHTRMYYIGYYLFEAKPPFKVARCNSIPIIYDSIYNESNIRVDRNDYVLFPTNTFYKDGLIILSIGENDSTTKIVSFLLEELIEKTTDKISFIASSIHSRELPCDF